jgi:peptidoglycan/LPS O-acetylase OafA/YrhL
MAVFAFYTLSGYLITRVLNERYGFTPRGTAAFLMNRVLRLWPAYLTILGLAIIALHFLPLSQFNHLIRLPRTPVEIIGNIAILGQVSVDFRQWSSLAKPAVTSWSLSIEIFSYLLLAIYFARSPRRLWLFAGIGAVALAFSTASCATSADPAAYGPYCFENRYGVLQAGFIPFAAGGLFYFHRARIEPWLAARTRWFAAALILTQIAMLKSVVSATIGPFLGIPLMYLLLAWRLDLRPAPAQDFFGRASYHLFIAHMPLAAAVVTGLNIPKNSLPVFIVTTLLALGLSAFLVPLEHRINRLRRRISGGLRGTAQDPAGGVLARTS